jgi:AraC-like DNA-binding protein
VFLIAEPDLPHTARCVQADVELIGLDPALVAAVLRSPHAASATLRPASLTPRSPDTAARWNRIVDYALAALGDEDLDDLELVVGATGRLLAAVAADTFGIEPAPQLPAADRRDAHPETLRRAIAFIEAHPHEDIGLTEIAAAAFVTPRAIQLAFRRHLDTTPMAYLRRVRLACAHDDLLKADPTGETVTTIASRWGFANPGRFAAAYRSAYGRPPGQTLRE